MWRWLILMVVLCPFIVHAEEYELRPRTFDLDPHDGFMDPGSYMNPYELYDERGNEVGSLHPRFFDLDPHDGFMDPGTAFNPYVIETPD